MRRAYVDLDHGQVHYRTAGTGRPLVLLHQTASSSVMYERLAPHLEDTSAWSQSTRPDSACPTRSRSSP